ncbi:16S rRNA m(2)G 1207 methyltransferase [Georgenia satyanarayanai]|uniref:16S rRNA m(2)G 1207 methyltransferase n=1 Tax=Georgenia satyanarayanai TaxID=860221 RepID=A0A2Y9AEY1_9MICO|nr:methyltransferase [Georgenia satyanarayanai]PYF99854.1 16S rRNA m(2)G 1207 methyltransferase [Georgenia satyanarayanai]SSA41838.1 16S rRNA m(2)G 1207 methyltransferase [Georgenia satyanarayanai]
MSEHYFTARPASPGETRTIDVVLRGRPVQVRTAPGVFSGDRLDIGTRVLLDAVPDPAPTGTLVDLGCGWGPITLAMAAASPAARVVAVDVNERARDLTARNAAALGLGNVVATAPEEAGGLVADGIDELWSNPPIRIGKEALHELLRTWLGRLAPAGHARLVVSKNLGADSLQRWVETELGMPTERLSSSKGFRVLDVRRG